MSDIGLADWEPNQSNTEIDLCQFFPLGRTFQQIPVHPAQALPTGFGTTHAPCARRQVGVTNSDGPVTCRSSSRSSTHCFRPTTTTSLCPTSTHVRWHKVHRSSLSTSIQHLLSVTTQVPLLGYFSSEAFESYFLPVNSPLVARGPASGRAETLVTPVFRYLGSPRASCFGRLVPIRRDREAALSRYSDRKFRELDFEE